MTNNRVLEYLKKNGQANTYRITRELGLDRDKILDIVKILEERKLIEFKSDTAKFLKFPAEEKKFKKPSDILPALKCGASEIC